MALVVPNGSEVTFLENILNKVAPQNLVLRLYTNNLTPDETNVAADFTEAAGNGYASVALTAASWTITPGAPTGAAYPEVTFTFTGALGNVYGYYITEVASGKLKWSERFPSAPAVVASNGDVIKVTLGLTLE